VKIIYEENGKTARIEDLDKSHHKSFHDLLSFKKEGVEYAPTYRNYIQLMNDRALDPNAKARGQVWDGITRLLSKSLKFSAGLVTTVSEHARSLGLYCEIEDLRTFTEKEFEIDITNRLIELNMVPRDYQVQALEAMLNNRRGIIKAGTGAGKTLVAAMAAAAIGKKCNVYVIGLDLLYSFHEVFESVLQRKVGRVGDGICEIEDINIISIWSVGKALGLRSRDILDEDAGDDEKYVKGSEQKILSALKNSKVHILDECHIASCNTISKIYDAINPEHLYGMSGTPFRFDNQDLVIKGVLGENLVDIKASLLIERKVLARPHIKMIPVPKQRLSSNYQEAYSEYIVNNEDRNQIILKSTLELIGKKYQVLVLFNNIKHGEILSDMFKAAGINFEMLNGKDDAEKRLDVKKKTLKKELDCLLVSKIFDVGIDLPSLSALVLAGSGKSYVRTLQRIGRVIRGYPGKTNVAVVDLYDQVKWFKIHAEKRMSIYSSEPAFKIWIAT
jgi:superfamily II DNA or RNA helicase